MTRKERNESHPTFDCTECDASYNTASAICDHMRTMHKRKYLQNRPPNVKLSKKRTAKSKDGIRVTLQSKRDFKYDTCGKTCSSQSNLWYHKQCHDAPFICEMCGQQLASSSTFKYHMTHAHSGQPRKIPRPPNKFVPQQENRFACKICSKKFADASGMYTHIKSVHKKIRAQCELCPKNFCGTTALTFHKKKAHIEGRSKVKKYKLPNVSCDICLRSLMGPVNMRRHIELLHFPIKSNCPFGCPGDFGNASEWTSHLEGCQSEKLSSKCYCFFCSEVFTTQLLRIAHHLSFHKSFSCEICSRLFTSRDVLDRHILAEHQNAKLFLCPKCEKGFRQKLNFTFHSTTVCGDDEEAKKELLAKRRALYLEYKQKAKAHKCAKCSKSFVDQRRLEDHKRKVHLNQEDNSEEEDN